MSWIAAILSVFLVLACLLLILLVLIQLPKKEAGMGQAFGGGATDALFGAGSGTALTKMTKYTTGIFFILTMLLWVLKAQEVRNSRSTLERTMQQLGKTDRTTPPPAPAASASTPAPPAVPLTNNLLTTISTNTTLLSAPTNGGSKPAPAPEAEKAK